MVEAVYADPGRMDRVEEFVRETEIAIDECQWTDARISRSDGTRHTV